jgi:hypothetical protein
MSYFFVYMFKSDSAQSNARASRKRAELLSSFDTLSSHLTSTFSALSTALARASSRNGDTQETADGTGAKKTGSAYLAILVGASISSAKSKVVVGIHGLEVKIWGTRDDFVPAAKMIVHNNNGEEAEEKEGENSDGEEEEDESDDGDEDDDDGEESNSDDDNASEPPSDSDTESNSSNRSESPPPPSLHPAPPTHAEDSQERALHVADRLLARTLAAFDGSGHSMASEMRMCTINHL